MVSKFLVLQDYGADWDSSKQVGDVLRSQVHYLAYIAPGLVDFKLDMNYRKYSYAEECLGNGASGANQELINTPFQNP